MLRTNIKIKKDSKMRCQISHYYLFLMSLHISGSFIECDNFTQNKLKTL
jgi:hypothetical protein